MKKIKITLVMALVAICGCFQANAFFRFGIKAGLNVDKLHMSEKSLDDDFNSSNRCGWTAGVMTEFTVPVIGVGADLSVMYTRMNSELPILAGTEKVSKNFLEIPLNLKYKLELPAISRIVIPYVYTGPTVALKLGGRKDGFINTKTAQWGWNLGLGVELIKHLQIGAGYTFGINNIVKLTGVDDLTGATVSNDIKLKNNYWTVSAAWLF